MRSKNRLDGSESLILFVVLTVIGKRGTGNLNVSRVANQILPRCSTPQQLLCRDSWCDRGVDQIHALGLRSGNRRQRVVIKISCLGDLVLDRLAARAAMLSGLYLAPVLGEARGHRARPDRCIEALLSKAFLPLVLPPCLGKIPGVFHGVQKLGVSVFPIVQCLTRYAELRGDVGARFSSAAKLNGSLAIGWIVVGGSRQRLYQARGEPDDQYHQDSDYEGALYCHSALPSTALESA